MVTMDQRGIGEGEGSTLLHCTVLGRGRRRHRCIFYYQMQSATVGMYTVVHCSAVQCIQNKYVHTAGVYIFVLNAPAVCVHVCFDCTGTMRVHCMHTFDGLCLKCINAYSVREWVCFVKQGNS